MPYPKGHRERTRTRIIRSAQELFNRHGFDQVSIDDVMKRAGLTRGGFYSYFKSKSELYAQSVVLMLDEPPPYTADVGVASGYPAERVIRTYLSQQHLDTFTGLCPMVNTDISRSDIAVRRGFEKVFKSLVDLVGGGHEPADKGHRSHALAAAALCVGGMAVASSLADDELASELRLAVMRVALELGEALQVQRSASVARAVEGARMRDRQT